MFTVRDIIEKLRYYDEITVMEMLEITSDDLVERFEDRVEDRYEYLAREMEELYDDE